MSKFTKEMVDNYAEKLLIGLTDEENKMVLEEIDEIDSSIDEAINAIPNLNSVEPMSWALDRCIDDLRSDVIEQSLTTDELLSNSDKVVGDEVEVPRVVSE